ncbi:MAG: histidine--tRNA ligase [Bacteroidota bacterium]|nr:histidine--tRNA ligase [Bacteroidota bacterium]
MARQTPGIPKGTRDFSSDEMMRRNFIFNTINQVYFKYGYQPIETPAIEKSETLTGKYGEEGDKLLFKILNSGNFLKKVTDNELLERDRYKLAALVTKKGLRYDLTVPFARFVVKNQSSITFPFKRSQIQPVWRADRPQKGRYREFYQCDADVIGTTSLLNELEMIQMMDEVFEKLSLKVTIRINNRKILTGIAEQIGFENNAGEIISTIDKLDKIGEEKVYEELMKIGIPEKTLNILKPVLSSKGGTKDQIKTLKAALTDTEIGIKGIEELEKLYSYISVSSFTNNVKLDISLARGLDYYTGTIFEVVSDELHMGSICGGGRYDNLTRIFGLDNMSGVGISFGADRIYDVILTLKRFPIKTYPKVKLLFINFGEKEELYCLELLKKLRKQNIASELYPEQAKMKKQMKYADNNNIPFVVMAGENEMKSRKYTLKNMKTGDQHLINTEELINLVSAQ